MICSKVVRMNVSADAVLKHTITTLSYDDIMAMKILSKKKGLLRKKQDFFGGWPARYFVLTQEFLMYFLEENDTAPKGTMKISKCEIAEESKVSIGGTNLWTFTVKYEKQIDYLAAESEAERKAWIESIRDLQDDASDEDDGPNGTIVWYLYYSYIYSYYYY